jgi:hypothetical protein
MTKLELIKEIESFPDNFERDYVYEKLYLK